MIRTLLFGLTYIALISLDSLTTGQVQTQVQTQVQGQTQTQEQTQTQVQWRSAPELILYANTHISVAPDTLPDASTLTDSIGNFATDSFTHRLGKVSQYDNRPLYKPMIYLGKDTIYFTRAWTSDPHFICDYPRGPIAPNQVYWIKICMSRLRRVGPSRKSMGLQTNTGERFHFRVIEMITED